MIKRIVQIILSFFGLNKVNQNMASGEDAPSYAKTPSSQKEPSSKVVSEGKAKGTRSSKPKKKGKTGTGKKTVEWNPDSFQVPAEEGKTRFHDFNFESSIMRGVYEAGFQYCTPIQAESLPYALDGDDVIGKAQTGTGKTAAFLLTIFEQLLINPVDDDERFASEPRALVIAPTRELALQIEKDAVQLGKFTGLNVYSVIGGIDYQKQRDVIRNQVVDLLIATPGRLIDFLMSNDLYLDQVEILVIDEADRMLDMGFIPDVKRIISRTPRTEHRQTLLFSATFTQDVINLSERWTRNAVFVEVESEQQTTDNVDQVVYMVESDLKLKLIQNYIEKHEVKRAIIFGNRRDETRRVQERLAKKGLRCELLSGEVPQNKRLKTLERFKNGSIDILVATDVAGRGIHVDGLSHVFNYNLPEDPEDYVHRIGRTGRAGAKGHSISFACEDEAFLIPEIEEFIGMKLTCSIPDADLLA